MGRMIFTVAIGALLFAGAPGILQAAPIAPLPTGLAASSVTQVHYYHHHWHHHHHCWWRHGYRHCHWY